MQQAGHIRSLCSSLRGSVKLGYYYWVIGLLDCYLYTHLVFYVYLVPSFMKIINSFLGFLFLYTYQVNNKLDIPADPLRPRGEGLGPCPEPTRPWGESLGPCPEPTSVTARSLSDYIYPGSFIYIFNSCGTIPLVEGLDPYSKCPPLRLLPLRWMHLSSRIPWFTELHCQKFPCSKYTSISVRQLWIVVWGWLSNHSYQKIPTTKGKTQYLII